MATLDVRFQGWFQCRLATDPDPFDEPRGVSGWTFAVAGEPDLDRVIRFQERVTLRPHVGPRPGVRVVRVTVDGQAVPGHPLLGGDVDLLAQPRFEGRNGLIADDGRELIVPFHLRVTADRVTLERRDPLDSRDQDVVHASPDDRKRREGRQRTSPGAIPGVPGDPVRLFEERTRLLQEDRERETDEVRRAALEARLWALEELLGFYRVMSTQWVQWGFNLGQHDAGRGTVDDPGDLLRGVVDRKAPWPLALLMGAWDADALCGFALGSLRLSITPSA